MTGGMVEAIAGGAIVGGAASALLMLTGKTRGVSGMATAALFGPERAIATAFLLGLAASGAALHLVIPDAFAGGGGGRPLSTVLAAGFAVGLGARLANGCTSGHGLFGIARGSRRSVVSIAIFIVTAMLVVTVLPPDGAPR